MILRTLALVGGLTGAAALSQFPEFGQQYTQRLGGAVSALAEVVADFDASAQAEGLSRADALASMVGTPFVERRRADMERTIDRYDHLRTQLDDWRAAGPVRRAHPKHRRPGCARGMGGVPSRAAAHMGGGGVRRDWLCVGLWRNRCSGPCGPPRLRVPCAHMIPRPWATHAPTVA